MKKIKIELSYDVAQYYGFTYLWKVHRCSADKSLCLEGGLLRKGVGLLGSIPIKIERSANETLLYVAKYDQTHPVH